MKTIRYRYKAGKGEYQVVQGTKIIGRYDLEASAMTAHPDAKWTVRGSALHELSQ